MCVALNVWIACTKECCCCTAVGPHLSVDYRPPVAHTAHTLLSNVTWLAVLRACCVSKHSSVFGCMLWQHWCILTAGFTWLCFDICIYLFYLLLIYFYISVQNVVYVYVTCCFRLVHCVFHSVFDVVDCYFVVNWDFFCCWCSCALTVLK